MQVILHVDLDAFSHRGSPRSSGVERKARGNRGRSKREGVGRGVVSSASYESRVRRKVSLAHIHGLEAVPPIAFISGLIFDLYIKASNSIMKILKIMQMIRSGQDRRSLSRHIKSSKGFDEAGEFAKIFMEKVLDKEKLTCSIGVAPNKIVAKIASDYKESYGLTVVKEGAIKGFLFP